MSEAAFTDSTTPHSLPAATCAPACGRSTYTMSPIRSWAWCVMPTVTVPSGFCFTHSCDFVYLRSLGIVFINSSFCLSSFHFSLAKATLAITDERILHDAHRRGPAAQVHRAALADTDGGRHARQRDRHIERGRKRAAGDLALDRAVAGDLLVVAQHALVFEHEPDELARTAGGILLFQGLAPNELAIRGLERDGPGQSGFERRGGFVHVRAIEIHPGLEPQRVARPEPAGRDAGLVQHLPGKGGGRGRKNDLESVLAGVAGRGDMQRSDRHRVKRLDLAGEPAELLAERPVDLLFGVRTLHRDHGEIVALHHFHLAEFARGGADPGHVLLARDRKSTRLN